MGRVGLVLSLDEENLAVEDDGASSSEDQETAAAADSSDANAEFHRRLWAISAISLSESFQANVIWSTAAFMLEVSLDAPALPNT